MAKDTTKTRQVNAGVNKERTIRKSFDEDTLRSLNPKTGEDPGLLPTTEDPRERRLKRNTM